MITFWITVLICLILALVGYNTHYKRKIKQLNKELREYQVVVNTAAVTASRINEELAELEIRVEKTKQDKLALETYLKAFIHGKLKVYVRSNFHSNFNIYNNKYYAKASASTVHNNTKGKVEGIPVLTFADNRYNVIDIYKLKKLIKSDSDYALLDVLEQSKTTKETLIQELGNKILTSYSQ